MEPKRSLILVAALLTVTVASTQAFAKTTCQPSPRGQLCISQVDFNSFAQNAYQNQQSSQWCWAAAISMLFSYYKHPVSQPAIVQSLYGRLVDLPSGPGWNIASRVNTTWVDANGKRFRAELTGAYDFDARVMTLNNSTLINELDQDRPFIVGTRGHAVVGTAIQYVQTPMGPYITSIGVFDPWPGRGARGLDAREALAMHQGGDLRFLATVRITEQE
ncbi:MAG TPA: papain-like cysteine protease family protein [Pyrinomonadaceae bacterium]|nr:papain-like cysteine protease family protein [Pyrinomonadaceae bacterium]